MLKHKGGIESGEENVYYAIFLNRFTCLFLKPIVASIPYFSNIIERTSSQQQNVLGKRNHLCKEIAGG